MVQVNVPVVVIGPPVKPVPVATLVTVPVPAAPVKLAGLMSKHTKLSDSVTVTSKLLSLLLLCLLKMLYPPQMRHFLIF